MRLTISCPFYINRPHRKRCSLVGLHALYHKHAQESKGKDYQYNKYPSDDLFGLFFLSLGTSGLTKLVFLTHIDCSF